MPFGNNLMLMALIGIFVVAALLLFLRGGGVEGFQDAGPGNGMGSARAFADKQRTYFYDQADKALYTNPSLNLPGREVNAALASIDTDLSKSPDIDYSNFFVTDPSGYFFEREQAMCANIDVPKNLPTRKSRDRVGCGWYFYSDPSRKSEGKIGTSRGPLFENLRGGEWIWDITKAQEKEEKKYCKALKTCDSTLETTNPLGPCGFCKDKGHAIPIQTNGAVKYSDTSCGTAVKRTAAECVEPPVITASNGEPCGTAGRPSPNGEARLYTQAECETLLKGVYNTVDSTCKSKDGVISYSVQCAPLNTPIVPTSPCTPVNGRLTTACLQNLARIVGFTSSGAMLKLISRGASAVPTDNDALAFEILRKEGGLEVIPEYYRGGPLTTQQVQSVYERIYSLRNNPSTRVSTAAKWLSVGGVELNFCDIDPTERGPFSTVCLQRAFRSAGCQAGGKKYPSERTAVSDLANMTWEQVNSSFKSLYNRMKSSDAPAQDAALTDCLGTGTAFYRPPVTNAFLEGPAINWGRPVAVTRTEKLNDGRTVYMIEDDGYTKMVTDNGEGRYYRGQMGAFNKNMWPAYTMNTEGTYRLRVTCTAGSN